MILAGGSVLAASVLMPAWLEYQAARHMLVSADTYVSQLRERATSLSAQIRHLQHDPAYVERLAREEFGRPKPDVRVIPMDALPAADVDADDEHDTASAAPRRDEYSQLGATTPPPDLPAAIATSPLTRIFLDDTTRQMAMIVSSATILAAIVLLCGGPPRDKTIAADER